MKRVLFCQPTLNSSGSEKSLEQIIRYYNIDNKEFIPFLLYGKDGILKDDITKYCRASYYVRAEKLSRSFVSVFWFLFSFITVFLEIYKIKRKEKIDIVYVNTLMFPQAFIAGKLNNIRTIVHVREVETTYPPIIYRFYFFIASLFSNQIIVVCNYILNQKIWFKSLFEKKYVTLYNSSNFKRKIRSNILSGQEIIKIISLIPLTEKKGIFDLLNSINILVNRYNNIKCHFSIVGRIPDPIIENKVIDFINKNNLGNFVSVLGEKKNVYELLNQHHLLVHPSKTEAFPRVIVEGLNLALPCIVTNAGGSSEAIKDGENGYVVEVGDVEKIAHYIHQISEKTDLYNTMSEKALESYEENFSIQVLAREFIESLDKRRLE